MTNETSPVQASAQAVSGVGAAPSRASTSGAAKVFREFKWGLLTLFLLMVVVIGLVYDGGRKKEQKGPAKAGQTPARSAALPSEGLPPSAAQTPAPESTPAAFPSHGRPPVGPTRTVQQPAPIPPSHVQAPLVPTLPPEYQPELAAGGPGTAMTPHTRPGPSVPAETAPTAQHTDRTVGEYLVQPGDTLEGIARKNYPGRTYKAIKAISKANGISDPRRLRAGMTLKLPGLPERTSTPATGGQQTAEPLTPSTPRTNVEPGEDDVYLVQAGDTLERIARKTLNDGRRWRDIYEWNRDTLRDPSILQIGQKLKIKKVTTTAAENSVEQEPQEEEAEQAPRRTVVQREESADATEERPSRPQPAERVEPLQRWMP